MTIQWEDWMTEGGRMPAGGAKEPTKRLLAELIVGAYENVSEDMGHNTWKKKGV